MPRWTLLWDATGTGFGQRLDGFELHCLCSYLIQVYMGLEMLQRRFTLGILSREACCKAGTRLVRDTVPNFRATLLVSLFVFDPFKRWSK